LLSTYVKRPLQPHKYPFSKSFIDLPATYIETGKTSSEEQG